MIKKIFIFQIVFILFIVVFAQNVSANEYPLVRTVFNERSGLPTGEANDVLQTSDGYVWVGSYGGLIRYYGNGYCEGIAGEDIPLVARIICVADTYDAMSSERCYRKPLSKKDIESELKICSGTQFDPKIVPHILDMIEDGTAERLSDIK